MFSLSNKEENHNLALTLAIIKTKLLKTKKRNMPKEDFANQQDLFFPDESNKHDH